MGFVTVFSSTQRNELGDVAVGRAGDVAATGGLAMLLVSLVAMGGQTSQAQESADALQER